MMTTLTTRQARHVIEVVGSSGTPPEWGFQFFSAGLDPFLRVIEEEYLRSFIKEGGASFKLVVGTYGGGKTHFLYSIRELAWSHDYLVAYCPLSHDASPFYKLDLVYKTIVVNLMRPLTPDELLSGAEKGIGPFLKAVHAELVESMEADEVPAADRVERLKALAADSARGVENPNFGRAVRMAFDALTDGTPDLFDQMIQYLTVSGFDSMFHRQMGILQPIDRGQAFATIRSLVSWVRNLRFKGLVILFDEAEQAGSMTSKQKEMLLSNLRELIDQCGGSAFANVMVFYAVPNDRFLTEGRSPAYEALAQRIQSVFDYVNPNGVKIRLDRLARDPRGLMLEIGSRLSSVYETAYRTELPLELKNRVVRLLAEAAAERAFGDIGYKRLFVQALIRALHAIRLGPGVPVDTDFARKMLEPGDSLSDDAGEPDAEV